MTLSLKEHNKLMKEKANPFKRFSLVVFDGVLTTNQSLNLVVPLEASRFSGISVVSSRLNPDDQVYIELFGTPLGSVNRDDALQLSSRLTGDDPSDLYQGWTYRDLANSRRLYADLRNSSTGPVSLYLEITGEYF